jgi:hypothetical protein
MRVKMRNKVRYVIVAFKIEERGKHLLDSSCPTTFKFREIDGCNLFSDKSLKGLAEKVVKGNIELYSEQVSLRTISAPVLGFSNNGGRYFEDPIDIERLVCFSEHYRRAYNNKK